MGTDHPGTKHTTSVTLAIVGLSHPAVVLAIVTLLVNDHVLKGNAPGWLTGKLSDFAGMLFFPFLATLAVALLRLPRPEWIAFPLTAVWFIAIKTMPWAASATASIHPWPVRIVVDPTDLFALLSLIPAIWVWHRQSIKGISPRRARQTARVALVMVAAVATIATSDTGPPALRFLTVVDDRVYIVESGNTPHDIWVSADQGATWESVEEATPDLLTDLLTAIYGDAGFFSNPRPESRCLSTAPTSCVRWSWNYTSFEVSHNGGLTWAADDSGSLPRAFGPDPDPYLTASQFSCLEDGATCARAVQGGVERRADYTTDGGNTWHAEPPPDGEWETMNAENGPIRCPVDQSNLCYRPIDPSQVWEASEDGGIIWHPVSSPTESPAGVLELHGVACLEPDHCFRVIEADPPENLYNERFSRLEETTNGGASWHPSWAASPRFNDPAPMPDQLVAVDETLVVSLGSDGLVRRTPDGAWETTGLGHVASAAATTDLQQSFSMTWVVGLTVALVVFGILLLIQTGDGDQARQTRPRWAGIPPLVLGIVLTPLYLAATGEYPYWLTNDAWIGSIFIAVPFTVLIVTAILVGRRSPTRRVVKDLLLSLALGLIPLISSLGIWDYV